MMRQNKTIFFAFVTILTIIIIYWFFSVLIIDRNEFNKIRRGMVNAEKNLERLNNERANYTSIKEARERQVQYFDTLKVHIPSKENTKGTNSYIETLDIIQRIAEENNIIINAFKPILINTFPEIEVEDKQLNQSIERYWLEMECNGNFISIGKFFEELQNQDRIINLLKFNIETEYGSAGRLFCEAIFYTYVFSEDY
ncbi:MAG: type 4a pilus biogenesis protein PilO [Planctomycetia bacterium]|nr:type 4a pilus biogenesis protein PilO [Planctomycetia bacterium]